MLIKMADLVENNLKDAVSIYYKFDELKLSQINDDIVDLHERLIEETCLDIMLRERPYAKDLRMVSGILKLVGDLERLGDHAEDLVEFATKLEKCDHHKIASLDKAVELAMDMVHNSILSLVNKDLELAKKVIKSDDIVDKLYVDCIDEIIKADENNTCSSKFAIYTTLVVKYIERIADHAVNVSEWVIYMLSGFHKDKQIF